VSEGQLIVGQARYLGHDTRLGQPDLEGTLCITQQWLGFVHDGDPWPGRTLAMSEIERVEIDWYAVPKDKAKWALEFTVKVLLGWSTTQERIITNVTVYTFAGSQGRYEIDYPAPSYLQSAMAPILEAAGVPFVGEEL
jgi:hypothetical protein